MGPLKVAGALNDLNFGVEGQERRAETKHQTETRLRSVVTSTCWTKIVAALKALRMHRRILD